MPHHELAYASLEREVLERGLFARTYGAYALTALGALALLGVSAYVVTTSSNVLVQLVNGILFGIGSVQLCAIGHDLSHLQVFKSVRINRFFSFFIWGLGGGLSESRWFAKHNKHHEGPNHLEHDPDLDIPFTFSEKQVASRSAFFKHWILPYQHVLFWVALPFIYPANFVYGLDHIARNLSARGVGEIILVVVHFVVLFWFVFSYLPALSGIVFIGSAFMTIGIYMSLAFAPNHKGEAILEAEEQFHWTQQITLTRNLIPTPLGTYLLAGLNFQIEHHLFPTMSRFKLQRAREVAKTFCARNAIPYHEVTWLESIKEIHRALKARAAGRP